MHFVTGGAYNGKKKWVNRLYNNNKADDIRWIEAGKKNIWPDLNKTIKNILVLNNFEQWIWTWLQEFPDMESIRDFGYEKILELVTWEKKSKMHQVVVIGNDMSKGVVPMDKKLRDWRDVTGWIYQDIINLANEVDLIWYGVSTKLKGREG
ncbi:MAG TPA: bifunctional adenosylcobinamide kinase/adenosylcobinamide-phosphate guanylyltransferase [Pseudogracilibacillus sp.]|nr:bifunctional adenosylcobinamide kinase/adenosylcobinamide-phosphate guanylyltransferase [Pseudogracilibacillus sp.]